MFSSFLNLVLNKKKATSAPAPVQDAAAVEDCAQCGYNHRTQFALACLWHDQAPTVRVIKSAPPVS